MVSDEKVGKVAGVWKGEWGGGGNGIAKNGV